MLISLTKTHLIITKLTIQILLVVEMNQYSSNHQPSHTLWYTPTPQKPFPFVYHNNLNHINTNYDDVDSDNSTTNANTMVDRSETASSSTITTLDKEHMFEKPLTPSDVGKLNRLVIPKQHAEKYLPLAAAANAANTTADGGAGGGLLLGFEDETGKCWRFRYSYWNSSQSYVLTKGWSRYVKEKKLDAGDVVLFERHRFEPDRFFIGWRRRGSNPPVQQTVGWTARSPPSSSYNFNINNNPNYNHEGYNSNSYYNNNHQQNVVQSQQCYAPSHQVSAFTNFLPQGKVDARQKSKKSGNSKRVRLFGVNLECEVEEEDENIIIEDEPQTSDGSSLSSQGQGQGLSLGSGSGSRMGPTSYNYIDYVGYPPNNHDHMDMNYSHDINQHMRNRLG